MGKRSAASAERLPEIGARRPRRFEIDGGVWDPLQVVRLVLPSLRDRLVGLTAALERRAADDVITLDAASGELHVRSRLDDAEEAAATRVGSRVVPVPDGLWEWAVRRDFVRSLPRGRAKRRLGDCLGGPQSRRRFVSVLAILTEDELAPAAFALYRRRRIRHWAARVLREAG